MLVSIIIPCFNNAAFVGEAVASALAQTHREIEVIVVDDGSTDGSADVVRGFDGVALVQQPNRGVSVARNVGFERSRGAYLVFLDADDRLAADAVAKHLEAFEAGRSSVLTFGVYDVVDEGGRLIKPHRQPARTETYWDILLGVTPNPSTWMVRREPFQQLGGFDGSLRYGEDWDVLLRLARLGDLYCHGAVSADYRKHGGQSTRSPSGVLRCMLGIIDRHQAKFSRGPEDERRFGDARLHYTRTFGKWIPGETVRHLQRRDFPQAYRSLSVFGAHLPHSASGFFGYARERWQRGRSASRVAQ